MTLVTSAIFPELDAAGGIEGLGRLDSTYTLTCAGGSWVLLTHRAGDTRPTWSTPLARHGAGPHASQRVAQAVAVRVLQGIGVEVHGWLPEPACPAGEARDVVALTAPATTRDRPRAPRGH